MCVFVCVYVCVFVCVHVLACGRAGAHEDGADMRHETRYEAPSGDAGMSDNITDQHRLFGRNGSAPGEFNYPQGLACLLDGNMVVVDSGNDRAQCVTPHGVVVWCVGSKDTHYGDMR